MNYKEFLIYGGIGLTGGVISFVLLTAHIKKRKLLIMGGCISSFAVIATSVNIGNYVKIDSDTSTLSRKLKKQINRASEVRIKLCWE